jgi:mono/diheme cytochrome c family protein
MRHPLEGTNMMKLLSVILGTALVASATVSAQDKSFDINLAAKGDKLFRTYCTACHGKTATGDGPLAKDLKATPANLTQLSENNGGTFPFDMVIKTIENGRRVRGHGTEDMPAWGDAFKMTSSGPDEPKEMMKELANYLWSIQSK